MKKLLLSFAIISGFSFYSYSQGLTLFDSGFGTITNTTVTINITTSSTTNTQVFVRNNGTSTKDVKVKRTIFTVAGTDVTNFNWSSYSETASTNTASFPVSITAGQTLTFASGGFQATFTSGTSAITRYVHYTFYDITNPTDSAGVTLKYVATVGIDEQSANNVVVNTYPNPAVDLLTVNYSIEKDYKVAKLVIFDVLGKAVKEIPLNEKKDNFKISVEQLNAGVYFCAFYVDEKAIVTRKIMVTSK